ncbi:hypothetical protein BUL40_02730 [Croceivirga radicis]|uniref:Rieske domain-containing protein n=1 Tax=Croceivirga radicis TaxID=1929488 RepID=A0A1V6LWB9_9FLAO|nr:hypothetical protein [Croceivirga radicis]OQD44482.1 hypothetical protein BUL40_02730 [Croceivirga radicis]
MKRYCCLIFLILLLACSKDATNRNPYLLETNFRFELNLNLPLYTNLNTIGNPVYVGNNGVGIRGAYVMKVSPDSYLAFEASCPNHTPNECSTMVANGQNVVCPCDDLEYSLFNGFLTNTPDDGNRYYGLLNYRTSQSGSSVFIFN